MTILDGKKISEKKINEIRDEIKKKNWNNKIGLAVIIIGMRKDSCVYVRKKIEACNRVGIEKLNEDDNIHGILIQLPIPRHLNEEKILRKINYLKDVDGFHANNMGYLAMERREPLFIPCTPLGCFELLKEYNIEIEGKEVVVIGKSNIVGLPMALIMMKEMATVTVCHIKTKKIEEHTKRADILIVGVGKAHLVKKDWVKEGAVVIDIGINVLKDETRKRGYRLTGDVDYENVKSVASYITPVPGGVGPMTVCMLIKNTLKSYKNLNGY